MHFSLSFFIMRLDRVCVTCRCRQLTRTAHQCTRSKRWMSTDCQLIGLTTCRSRVAVYCALSREDGRNLSFLSNISQSENYFAKKREAEASLSDTNHLCHFSTRFKTGDYNHTNRSNFWRFRNWSIYFGGASDRNGSSINFQLIATNGIYKAWSTQSWTPQSKTNLSKDYTKTAVFSDVQNSRPIRIKRIWVRWNEESFQEDARKINWITKLI